MNELFAWLNENSCTVAIVFILLMGGAFVVAQIIDNKSRKNMKRQIQQMSAAVASKEKRIAELESEVWRLKVDRFAADQDAKREIKKRESRIQQLETDKKQMMKWGTEK